jgi:hypothetical protein
MTILASGWKASNWETVIQALPVGRLAQLAL